MKGEGTRRETEQGDAVRPKEKSESVLFWSQGKRRRALSHAAGQSLSEIGTGNSLLDLELCSSQVFQGRPFGGVVGDSTC